MKLPHSSVIPILITTASLFAFAMPQAALSEASPAKDAITLLDEAKTGDYQRKLAAKQTELDRLNEDRTKGAKEIETLETSIQKVGAAVDDATKNLDLLTLQKRRATRELELLELRITAEKLKNEGLKMLQQANRKAQEAVKRRGEEADARIAIVALETQQITAKSAPAPEASGPAPRSSKNEPSLSELKKKLDKAERAATAATYQAREAMSAATSHLREAEAAAAKVEKKQAETGQ